MKNSSQFNGVTVFRVMGSMALLLLMGAALLQKAYGALSSGQFLLPRKFSGPSIFVLARNEPIIFYGLLIFAVVVGIVLIALPFAVAWRYWQSNDVSRRIMLESFMPHRSGGARNLWRGLFLFGVVPLIVFAVILVAMVHGQR